MTDQAIEQLTNLFHIVAAGGVLFTAGFALAYFTGGKEFREQVKRSGNMSSYPEHEENLKQLKQRGFDVEEYLEDPYESWDYDTLVYIISDLIQQGARPAGKTEETAK